MENLVLLLLQVCDCHDPAENAARVLALAKDMLMGSRMLTMPHDGSPVVVRIGIHTGPCVSGLTGNKMPKFTFFGEALDTATRLVDRSARPGRIQISAATHALLSIYDDLLSKDGAVGPWGREEDQAVLNSWETSGVVEVRRMR